MKKIFTFISLCMIAFNAIHAEITWYLSDNGTLTISGTNMRNYTNSDSDYTPWYRQRNQIKKVVIENGVTNIGARAFSPCANLTSVTIPESVTSIGASAFYGCEGLTSIAIPNSVTNIGSGAFMGCPGLNSINIPNSVTSIGSAAFYGCVALKSITIPNSVTNIESFAFYACKTLTSVTIPNTVTSIGNNAFGYCSGLKSVTIPNSVTNIEEEAFRDCPSLTSVTIPESVTSIGNNAFSNCPGLTSITCKAVTPPNCYNYNFYQVNKSIPVYVPANSIGAYKTTNGWRDFENIQAIIEPENISFSQTNERLALGSTKTLTAIIAPENATNKIITWTSSNTAVATVSSEGIVTAKNLGTTIITAKTYNDKSATCEITVEQAVTSITLSEATVSLWVGNTKALTATVTPTTASNPAVNWSSSNNNVATVSSQGVITAKGKGTCTITCTAADGYGTKSTCEVTVKEPVTSIVLSDVSNSIWVGENKAITATASPTTASNTSVSWSSSDNSVATVSSKGVITAKGKGTCTITCTAADGYGAKSTCEVTVKQQVTEITLNETAVSLWLGDTKTLTATTTPTTANNTNVSWSSSDDKVATVSSKGIITAKGKGTCTITCTAADGYGTKSTCSLTVKQQVTEISLSETTVSLWVGDTKNITATVTPTTANNTAVTWSSSDNSVATVSSKGVITAKGKGTCTITCTAADGCGTKSTCEVSVKQQVAEIALSETTASLWVGNTKTFTATISPTTANNTAVSWSSSNNNVATVSSKGVITAKGKGICTITCTAADGYGTKSTCKLTVKQQVNSIDFGYETLTIACGEEKTLTPTINPSNADVKTLTWKSTDKSVATITSEGVLTAVSPGTATITCTATDDFKKSSSITVIVEPLDITITDKNPTIKEGTYREGGISYTRTLTKNKYTTFCMPYDVNLSDYTDYFSNVYVPTGMAFVKSGGKLTIMFKSVSLTETIRAGQPFIALASKSGTVAIKNSSKITITSLDEPQPTNLEVYNYGGNLLSRNTDVDVQITGNYSIVTDLDDANNFTFSVNGQMVSTTTVSPYRFYITKNDERSSAKITDILLSFDGEEATGIDDIINEQKGDDKFYNLNGQRINKSNAQKGVYIINGKKVVVK